MVDLETTGTDPSRAGIIQIAAIRFDYKTGEIDSANLFNRCLFVPGFRSWDVQTKKWWEKQGKILERIEARSEDPRQVLMDFTSWATLGGSSPRMWAKPISFEFPLLQGYCRDFGVGFPFHYRETVDINSFMRGRFDDPAKEAFDKEIPNEEAHDAIYDVIHQIQYVMEIKRRAAAA